jgi:putative transposase
MGRATYIWRQLSEKQRVALLNWRKRQRLPWHRPPHRESSKTRYHITAACFEHKQFIGYSSERMEFFCGKLLEVFAQRDAQIHAWCVLPNHYHALIETTFILEVLADLGRMHGTLSFQWNGEEQTRGRQVWCGAVERYMRNERHFWATMNYVHNNPVHHGYVERWQDWPYSSAREYLEQVGHDEAARIWRQYPILGYGRNWDDQHM